MVGKPRVAPGRHNPSMVDRARQARSARFKARHAILESDLIHGRRADGRDVDWMLHVNPRLEERGMLLVYNPLDQPVERRLEVNLYYTGIEDHAGVSH